jgi:hypothetical protein
MYGEFDHSHEKPGASKIENEWNPKYHENSLGSYVENRY